MEIVQFMVPSQGIFLNALRPLDKSTLNPVRVNPCPNSRRSELNNLGQMGGRSGLNQH
jgi:hypothetical protein